MTERTAGDIDVTIDRYAVALTGLFCLVASFVFLLVDVGPYVSGMSAGAGLVLLVLAGRLWVIRRAHPPEDTP